MFIDADRCSLSLSPSAMRPTHLLSFHCAFFVITVVMEMNSKKLHLRLKAEDGNMKNFQFRTKASAGNEFFQGKFSHAKLNLFKFKLRKFMLACQEKFIS